MSAFHRAGFKPPSEGFWSRLIDTPLTELWHGRVTGSANARRIIAHAGLPQIVTDGIWRCVQSSRLRRANRLSLAAELVSTSARQCAAGQSEEDLAAELNERALLVDLIETGKLEPPTAPRRIPLELSQAIQQIAIRVRGQARRREVALALYERCAVELQAGATAGQLVGWSPDCCRAFRSINSTASHCDTGWSKADRSCTRSVATSGTTAALFLPMGHPAGKRQQETGGFSRRSKIRRNERLDEKESHR